MTPVKDTQKQTRKSRSTEKRQHILSAAMALLRSGGLEGMSMRMIAEKAGISLGNLQYHFKTRPEILEVLAENFLDEYLNDCRTGIQAAPAPDLESAFESLMILETGADCAIVFKEFWALSYRDETCRKILERHYQRLHDMLCGWLAGQLPKGTGQDKVAAAVDILLPLLEGHCVTNPYLRPNVQAQAQSLAELARQLAAAPVKS